MWQKAGSPFTDRRNLVTLSIIAGVILVDLFVKEWVRTYPPGWEIARIGFLRITHISNTGAAFGIFQGLPVALMVVGCVGAVVLIVLAVVVYRRFPYLVTVWNRVAFGLVFGGDISNLLDRFRFGAVTDFIDPGFWPVFNGGDSAINIGAVMLAISFLRLAFSRQRV